jgi:hypothetical protein
MGVNQIGGFNGRDTGLLFCARARHSFSVREPHFAATRKFYEAPNNCSLTLKDVFGPMRNALADATIWTLEPDPRRLSLQYQNSIA